MQRVEPADVRAIVDPPTQGPAPVPSSVSASDNAANAEAAASAEAGMRYRQERAAAESGGSVITISAFAFSCLWLAALGAYGVGLVGMERLLSLSNEWLFVIASVAIVPVALAWLMAVLLNEAYALRQQSAWLANTAANLTVPEDHAARNLSRLSRAIRRELDTFNVAIESASSRLAQIESAANERLALIERTAAAAQERVERATGKLGSEREKLAQFTQALDSVVLAASETLTTRLQDARAAARSASESLHAEHGAIAGLISTLQSASHSVSAKALETSKEIERQAQRLDAASEAAAARSEQVVARHERQRMAFAETIERLKQENDHMARALDYQREGMNKLVIAMADENKKIGTFTIESARRLDDAASGMAQRIVETTQMFSREAERLRTSTELTTSGLEQAMQTIRSAGDSSFDAAGRLGSVLVGLRDTATNASQQIEGTVSRLSKMLKEMPSEAAGHVTLLRTLLDEQSQAMRELNGKVAAAFDRVQAIEMTRAPAPLQLETPLPPVATHQPSSQPLPPRQHYVQQQAPVHQLPYQQHQSLPQSYGPISPSPAAHFAPPPVDVTPRAPTPKSHTHQPGRDAMAQRPSAPHFRGDPDLDHGVPNFNVSPPGAQSQIAGYAQSKGAVVPLPDRGNTQQESSESRGWFGLAKRFVRNSNDEPEQPPEDRGNWDIKSLLAAAETREGDRRSNGQAPQSIPHFRADPRELQRADEVLGMNPPHNHQRPDNQRRLVPSPQDPHQPRRLQPVPQGNGATANQTSSRHMIETLQAMAIDLCRFLEDEPPHELLKRYRAGERNVFARRLASILGAEHVRIIARKYHEDREFRDTVDRYVQQFEALFEQTARSDKENVLVETYLTSQTGKVYVTLASAIGRLS